MRPPSGKPLRGPYAGYPHAPLIERGHSRTDSCMTKNCRRTGSALECVDVGQKRPRGIADFANTLTGAHATEQISSSFSMTGARGGINGAGWLETDICYPRLDRAKCESALCTLWTPFQLLIIYQRLITEMYVERRRPVLRQID